MGVGYLHVFYLDSFYSHYLTSNKLASWQAFLIPAFVKKSPRYRLLPYTSSGILETLGERAKAYGVFVGKGVTIGGSISRNNSNPREAESDDTTNTLLNDNDPNDLESQN